MRSRSYQDQQGATKYITEVVVDDMVMLGSRNSNEGGTSETPQPLNTPSAVTPKAPDTPLDEEEDDLPF